MKDLSKIVKRLEQFKWKVESDVLVIDELAKEIDDPAINDLAKLIYYEVIEILEKKNNPF